MTRDTITATPKAREPDLRRHGARHIALSGSASRAQATEASDINILVDLQSGAPTFHSRTAFETTTTL